LSAAWLLPAAAGRLPGDADRRRLDVTLGVAMLAVWAVNQVLELVPWRYELQRSLPLHACDVVGLVAALALLTGRRVWRAMLYYWGIGLSTRRCSRPELAGGLATFNFWSFWVPHGGIIALAVYDLAARGYRPGWRGLRDRHRDAARLPRGRPAVRPDLRVNYGYVGRGVPGQPSVIDFLGDWPGRTVKLCVAVSVFLALITLPWVLVRRRADRRAAAAVGRRRGWSHWAGAAPVADRVVGVAVDDLTRSAADRFPGDTPGLSGIPRRLGWAGTSNLHYFAQERFYVVILRYSEGSRVSSRTALRREILRSTSG
jgi:hypothetical integral membrane protein (TIGR02206 family)